MAGIFRVYNKTITERLKTNFHQKLSSKKGPLISKETVTKELAEFVLKQHSIQPGSEKAKAIMKMIDNALTHYYKQN